ncbi:MAG TPA: ATP-dependent helicase [Ktedonobacter sp.]|nr:ATP-dependent helicase [Ktedonobacter sp.]
MIVVHALWDASTSTFHLWAESSELYNTHSGSRTTRTARTSHTKQSASIAPHPFALAHDTLLTHIGEFAGSLAARSMEQGTLPLRLPSAAKRPLPSPALLVDQVNEEQGTLRQWTVPTLTLTSGLTFDVLLALPQVPPYGIVFGNSLRYWATVANLSLELLTRQAFMPTLIEAQNGNMPHYGAHWKASIVGTDEERVASLSHMMPPLCWSSLSTDTSHPSQIRTIVQDFLDQTIDAFIRESCTASMPTKRGTNLALPEQWLRALTTTNTAYTTLHGSTNELKQFSSTLHSWLDQLATSKGETAFRTCFRLEVPELSQTSAQNDTDQEANAKWHLTFHLQANDDPSLLVPAEQVWSERSGTLTFLKRNFENPQERLLTDLAMAARLFPLIETSLHTARPQEIELSTEQAYQFLRQATPLLEQSGFGVLVPPWWQKSSARLRTRLQLKPKVGAVSSSSLLGLDGVVAYNWQIALGDTALSFKEFERIVKLKMPLVQVRGQWVELQPHEIEKAIAFFKKKQHKGEMSLNEALRLGLGQNGSDLGLPVEGVEAEGWIDELLHGLQEGVNIQQIEQPDTLHGTLRPYQRKGFSWLAFLKQFGLGACLADDMGLGKTLQLLTLLLYEREKQKEGMFTPSLLICPMSIVGNWQRELQRFAPSLSVMVHHGPDRLSGETLLYEMKRHDVVLTTYNIALRDKEDLTAMEWENVVIDEAQNIKNETAKQTQAIKQLHARYKVALTGTPVENRLSELWSIMEFLNPGYLGSGEKFRKGFAIPIERYHDKERSEMLRRVIQPFVLRRQKTDKSIIQDLPEKMEMKVFCNLTREQASLYEAVVKEMMEKIQEAEGMERRGLILATLTKLKQVCNHPAQFIGDGSSLPRRSGKLIRLEEMLEEVQAEGDKALIFTQYAEMGEMLRRYLQESLGYETLFLHGGTPKKQRDAMVQRFQEDRAGTPFFILSIKAGGVGLNLTAANHVFHFDRWWNPAVENQATDRAFRIGQKRNVQVHKFICVGTLEERIDQMIEQKRELAENIVGSGENWLTEMSTSQLKELFALSRDAVGE